MTAPRGAGGRFARRDAAPAGDPQPAPAPQPVPGQLPLVSLRVEPVDPGPRPADAPPPPELPPDGFDPATGTAVPSDDARTAVAVVLDGVDAIIRRALGPEYCADPDELDGLKAAALPVAVRAASLVGAGDAVTRTLPEPVLEVVRLAAHVWLAYSAAIAEAWATALAARRGELEDSDDDDDPAARPPGRDAGDGRGFRGGDPAGDAGGGRTRGAARGPVGGAPDAPGRAGAAEAYRARLAAGLLPPRPVGP